MSEMIRLLGPRVLPAGHRSFFFGMIRPNGVAPAAAPPGSKRFLLLRGRAAACTVPGFFARFSSLTATVLGVRESVCRRLSETALSCYLPLGPPIEPAYPWKSRAPPNGTGEKVFLMAKKKTTERKARRDAGRSVLLRVVSCLAYRLVGTTVLCCRYPNASPLPPSTPT